MATATATTTTTELELDPLRIRTVPIDAQVAAAPSSDKTDDVAEASRLVDAGVPEGGYGWVAVAGGGMMCFWYVGLTYCWGVIQSALVKEGLASASTLSFVGKS